MTPIFGQLLPTCYRAAACAAFLFAPALLASKFSFKGSVPMGTASSTPLALTLRDAIERGLAPISAYWLVVKRANPRVASACELDAPSTQVNGALSETVVQIDLKTIGFNFENSRRGHSDHRWSVPLHRCAGFGFIQRVRLQSEEKLSRLQGERTLPPSRPFPGRPRPGSAVRCERLSSRDRRLLASGIPARPSGNRSGHLRPHRRPEAGWNGPRHRCAPRPGRVAAAATAIAR